MDPSSHLHSREGSDSAQPACATSGIQLGFTPHHVGPMSIVVGLRCLALGESQTETWVVAQEALPDRPEHIIAQCTVAFAEIDGVLVWRYCAPDGDPLGPTSEALLPAHEPQNIEIACAQLCARLFSCAQQHNAMIFRVAPVPAAATEAPPVAAYPDRIWHRIATRERRSTPVTTAQVRSLLCRAKQLSQEAADRELETHACSSGLILIGEDWYSSVTRLVLPPMTREDYERIVRALRLHIRDCDSDRIRHGHAGNHGAARALASEDAAARRTLGLIENLTQELL